MNNTADSARGVQHGSFEGGEDDEHKIIGLAETPEIFAMKDDILFATIPFDRVD